jgi:hypothetical protein
MGFCKKLQQDIYNLYFLPNIIRNIKSRRMGLIGHVARMGENRSAFKVSVRKPEVKG